jgi:hypothetical protein
MFPNFLFLQQLFKNKFPALFTRAQLIAVHVYEKEAVGVVVCVKQPFALVTQLDTFDHWHSHWEFR